MEKTKIDWAQSTWNPVTGCKHGCGYCYARGIATRFGGKTVDEPHILDEPYVMDGKKRPYPFGFTPTLHRYRLDEYANKDGRNIFVCSMADLFGEWVPDKWLQEVFEACKKNPQHNYLFLTKNPSRYKELLYRKELPTGNNFWYGTSVTDPTMPYTYSQDVHTFLSIEPLLEDFGDFSGNGFAEWVIIGAETGRRKDKVIPKREWIENLVDICRQKNVPVFMKSSLTEVWGETLIQEYPKELRRK